MIPPVRHPIDERGFVVTRTGLVIGLRHQRKRPLHNFTRSEEEIQRALLASRQPTGLPSRRLENCVLAAALAVGVLGSFFFGG